MYLSKGQLEELGLSHCGKSVFISDRARIYRPEDISIGNNCRIDDDCLLTGNITIGNNCHIAARSVISGGRKSYVRLGDNVTISYNCTIISRSNDYKGFYPTGMNSIETIEQDLERDTILSEHCILGIGTSVLPGVEVAKGTAIGAHSLILENIIEPWLIYAGTPAKKISLRSKKFVANLFL